MQSTSGVKSRTSGLNALMRLFTSINNSIICEVGGKSSGGKMSAVKSRITKHTGHALLARLTLLSPHLPVLTLSLCELVLSFA